MNRLVEQVLLVLLAAAIVFGGWNWWRKNVYYEALQNVAAENVKKARAAEEAQRRELAAQAEELKEKHRVREAALQEQLAEIMLLPPAERVVYRLRDRWLPVSCPAAPGSGGVQTTYGGLQPADEQFLVRFAAEADGVTDTLTACQAALKTMLGGK